MNNKSSSNRLEAQENKSQSEFHKPRGHTSFSPSRGMKEITGKHFFKPFNKPTPVLSNYNVQNIKIDAVKSN
jgi:hypothetical protein